MVYTIEAYNMLLGIPDTYRLKNDGSWVANEDFHVFDNEDKLFATYNGARRWLNSNKTVEIKGETVSTKKRTEGPLLEKYFSFEIVLHRQEKPHMFTQQEIFNELKRGNDGVSNILVIDEMGFSKLLAWEEFIYSDPQRYPVRLESFDAGNGYVGKERTYENVDSEYRMCLEAWLLHLQCGRSIRQDFSSKGEQELIEEIKKELTKFN